VFSFIIPMLNEAPRIAPLLTRLRRDFPGSELLVVDGGSRDASVAGALPLADSVFLGPPGRARQMNLGAACARGEWLCFLHADTQPLFDEPGLGAALTAVREWGFCQVELAGRHRSLPLISWFMNRRAALTSVATGDQLLIVRRQVFQELGGFADMPLMEDVDICKRLRAGSRAVPIALKVRSSGRRWDEQGALATVLRMWLLRLAFFCGVSPERLHGHYYGSRALRAETPDA
jgi:rSAM/selenodomain-associated transferase 2